MFAHDVARDCLSQQEAGDCLLTTRRVCDCLTHSRRLVCLCAAEGLQLVYAISDLRCFALSRRQVLFASSRRRTYLKIVEKTSLLPSRGLLEGWN